MNRLTGVKTNKQKENEGEWKERKKQEFWNNIVENSVT
jgi:hypothetical protein